MAEVEEQVEVQPQNGIATSGAVIPTLADLTYIKNATPPAE